MDIGDDLLYSKFTPKSIYLKKDSGYSIIELSIRPRKRIFIYLTLLEIGDLNV